MIETATPSKPQLAPPAAVAFAYEAQTIAGQPVSGTIDAPSMEQAQRLLAGLRLRVLRIEPADRPPRTRAIRGEDFAAFNQQLAHLTSAGMPVEHGLRLIAQDMRRGRLANTVKQLAAELERGTPLELAFEKHQDRFPPLYARLVGAGVRSGDLPGMLLNLGRHMELVQRLRASLWRAFAYPLMVLAGVALVVAFLSAVVIPQFRLLFRDLGMATGYGSRLPAATRLLLALPDVVPYVAIALAALAIACAVAWAVVRARGAQQAMKDRLLLPLPLIGPVLRNNLVARWCDAVRLGVRAGLDLPRAIQLANDSVASPALRKDGDALIGAVQAGRRIGDVRDTRVLPATVVAAMSLAGEHHDLPATLAMLSSMYQQQAEMRLAVLPTILTPILVVLVAGLIGIVIAALFLPFLQMFSLLS